jgi:hypothetical protein
MRTVVRSLTLQSSRRNEVTSGGCNQSNNFKAAVAAAVACCGGGNVLKFQATSFSVGRERERQTDGDSGLQMRKEGLLLWVAVLCS